MNFPSNFLPLGPQHSLEFAIFISQIGQFTQKGIKALAHFMYRLLNLGPFLLEQSILKLESLVFLDHPIVKDDGPTIIRLDTNVNKGRVMADGLDGLMAK